MGGFRGGQWSGSHQLIWTQGKKGDAVEIEFNVADGGRQEVIVVLTKANDFGIVQLAIDGKDLGKPIDCYDPRVTTTGEISLGTLDLGKGKHVLRATVIGSNDKAKNGVGAGLHRFLGFVYSLHLHLYAKGMGRIFPCAADYVLHAEFLTAQGGDVVVLDEDAVGQVVAVVVASPHSNGVLLHLSQSWNGLAGV